MIRIWNAFSSNNSSSCRLIARFDDPRVARETAAELAQFLLDHIRQTGGDWIESEASAELARKYGFAWTDLLDWSPHLNARDEPQVVCDGTLVFVYHRYCQGFGDLRLFLEAKGADVEPEAFQTATISALFRSTRGTNPTLDAELDALFAPDELAAKGHKPFATPWPTRRPIYYGTAAGFRDAGTVGLWAPLAPQDLAAFEHWLAAHGIERPSLRWCEDGDEKRFRAIAAARCTACGSGLEYLDPRVHDIETPQLVCRPCGGLYDLAAFVPAV